MDIIEANECLKAWFGKLEEVDEQLTTEEKLGLSPEEIENKAVIKGIKKINDDINENLNIDIKRPEEEEAALHQDSNNKADNALDSVLEVNSNGEVIIDDISGEEP